MSGFSIFIAAVAALAIVSWIYLFAVARSTDGAVNDLWSKLVLRLVLLGLVIANLAFPRRIPFWVVVAAIAVWAGFEMLRWRQQAPARRREREAIQQRRAEVFEILEQYQRTHGPDGPDQHGPDDSAQLDS